MRCGRVGHEENHRVGFEEREVQKAREEREEEAKDGSAASIGGCCCGGCGWERSRAPQYSCYPGWHCDCRRRSAGTTGTTHLHTPIYYGVFLFLFLLLSPSSRCVVVWFDMFFCAKRMGNGPPRSFPPLASIASSSSVPAPPVSQCRTLLVRSVVPRARRGTGARAMLRKQMWLPPACAPRPCGSCLWPVRACEPPLQPSPCEPWMDGLRT